MKDKDEFNREDLDFYITEVPFKGLSKDYIMSCIFEERIQKNWIPEVGDIIVGSTGNIFVISNYHDLATQLGGRLFFFGGSLCARGDSIIANDTFSYTMNKGGKWLEFTPEGPKEIKNFNHSSWKEFRFVPYPHELKSRCGIEDWAIVYSK